MEKIQNPNKKLELLIKNPDLTSLSTSYGELVLDGIMSDGILKNVPLIGTIIGVIKFGNSINQHLTAKKIYKFIFELHKISKEKRIRKVNEINSSKKYQSNVGETVFEILEKIESDGKPEIIGKIFAAVIEDEIDYETFLKAAHIVKSLFYFDLVWLKESYDGEYLSSPVPDTLAIQGLTKSNVDFTAALESQLNFDDKGNQKKSEKYIQEKDTLSEMGKLIVETGMK